MPRDGPGPGVRRSRRLREAPQRQAAAARRVASEDWRDWAKGLPDEVLAKVAGTVVSSNEADWAARLEANGFSEAQIHALRGLNEMRGGSTKGLFVFARVCKEWRKAQLKVGAPLRTRVVDVILPGSVALAKWALAEGCPRADDGGFPTMATEAASHGHLELVRWLCEEEPQGGGFEMDDLMTNAVIGGNLEMVQWLKEEGCKWEYMTCYYAVIHGRVEVLRWLRENGCPWTAVDRDRAAEELGYTDDFGNLVDYGGNPVQ